MMRRLTFFVAILALLYSGYWFAGSRATQSGASAGLAALENQGWQVGFDDLTTAGFPSRFDTTVTGIDILAPDGATGWQAPFVQALSLSYQPQKAIVVFPDTQTLRIGGIDWQIDADKMRASMAIGANTDLDLQDVTLETGQTTITSSLFRIGVGDGLAALRKNGPAANTYDVYARLGQIALPGGAAWALGDLPVAIDRIEIDMSATLDQPLDRRLPAAWADAPPQLQAATLRGINVTWGDLKITGQGNFTVDTNGVPDGQITLDIAQWQQVVAMLVRVGAIPRKQQFLAQSMAASLANGTDSISLPISFLRGQMTVASIPVGPAPHLTLR